MADEIHLTHSFCLLASSASSALCKRKLKPSSCLVEREDKHQVAMLLVLGLGVQLLGRGSGPAPEHMLSLQWRLARHSVLTSCSKARLLGLRSQILVLRGWMIIRNAGNKLIILQEEFYLASTSQRLFSDYSESRDLGKSYRTVEGYINSIDHCWVFNMAKHLLGVMRQTGTLSSRTFQFLPRRQTYKQLIRFDNSEGRPWGEFWRSSWSPISLRSILLKCRHLAFCLPV